MRLTTPSPLHFSYTNITTTPNSSQRSWIPPSQLQAWTTLCSKEISSKETKGTQTPYYFFPTTEVDSPKFTFPPLRTFKETETQTEGRKTTVQEEREDNLTTKTMLENIEKQNEFIIELLIKQV